MGYRQWDWECSGCGGKNTHLVWTEHGKVSPKSATFHCFSCGDETIQERCFPVPAPYLGERVLNPIVYGGSYDTMGCGRKPLIPDMPGEREHNRKLSAELNALPKGKTHTGEKNSDGSLRLTSLGEERRRILEKHEKHAPSTADLAEHMKRPECREAFAEGKRVDKLNQEKRQRHKAMLNGEKINFRRDKCKGDPAITA